MDLLVKCQNKDCNTNIHVASVNGTYSELIFEESYTAVVCPRCGTKTMVKIILEEIVEEEDS